MDSATVPSRSQSTARLRLEGTSIPARGAAWNGSTAPVGIAPAGSGSVVRCCSLGVLTHGEGTGAIAPRGSVVRGASSSAGRMGGTWTGSCPKVKER